jgi:GTP-binding protein Era
VTEFRSGFVALLGRPNVGKSSIVNAVTGRKISIVSDKPQTTRHRVMGVYTREAAQLVFVDTPGLHKAVSALGERVNATALGSTENVDVPCLVLDATQPFGKGDRWVAGQLDLPRAVVIVNKVDAASKDQVFAMLTAAGELDAEAYFPVSARTGDGIAPLVDIIVERTSQKGMVIGKGGLVLKEVGTRVREQLPPGAFLELRVRVDQDWQRRPDRVERLGY